MKADQSSSTIINGDKKILKDHGNIHIDSLKQIIVSPLTGKPDFLAIDLYSEARSWFKPKVTKRNGNIIYSSKLISRGWRIGYKYFEKKYRCTKETIRKKFILLENLGLLSRDFSYEFSHGRIYNNCLNILVWKDTPFFYSEIGLEKTAATPPNLGSPCTESGGSIQGNLGSIYSNTNNRTKEIEDSPLRAISSISRTHEKTAKKIETSSTPSGLPFYGAASHPSSSKIKKKKRISAKIIPFTAREEEDIEIKRRQRTSTKAENEQGFTLIAGLFKDFKLLHAPPDVAMEVSGSQLATDHNAASDQTRTIISEDSKMTIPLKPTSSQLWDAIRQEALANLEHAVDRWDLKFEFNQLEVNEDLESSLLELKGSKHTIKNIRKNHYKTFTESFYKIAPNHTFNFMEITE